MKCTAVANYCFLIAGDSSSGSGSTLKDFFAHFPFGQNVSTKATDKCDYHQNTCITELPVYLRRQHEAKNTAPRLTQCLWFRKTQSTLYLLVLNFLGASAGQLGLVVPRHRHTLMVVNVIDFRKSWLREGRTLAQVTQSLCMKEYPVCTTHG